MAGRQVFVILLGLNPFGGEFLHASIPAMAAAYLFHLCQNHAFIDGNNEWARTRPSHSSY